MPNLNTDKERLDEFQRAFSDDLLGNLRDEVLIGSFSNQIIIFLETYDSYKDKLKSHFDNEEVEKKFENFNIKFTKFSEFLSGLTSPVFGVETKETFRYEIPEESKEEAIKALDELENEYRDFVFGSRKILLNSNELDEAISDELSFSKNGVLKFHGKEILISKSKNSDPYYLLETIFKDRGKTWSYDEIWKDWDFLAKKEYEDYEEKFWRKFYNAGYAANEKIAKETMIKDFLIYDKTKVFINPKYNPT